MVSYSVKLATILMFIPFVDVISQSNLWIKLGPVNTAIYMTPMIYDKSSGYLFAATSQGAMRYSTSAQKWTTINKGLIDSSVHSLAINREREIFAGTSEAGVFKSTDLGDSWSPLNNSPQGFRVITLAINTSGHMFAGTFGGGAYRSIDNGNTWKQINNGITSAIVTSFLFDSANITYASTDTGGGIFRSTNNGDSWQQIINGLTWYDLVNEHGPVIRGMAKDSKGNIFVAVENGGIHQSTDRGANWVRINKGMKDTVTVSIIVDSKDQVFVGEYYTLGVYRSTNSGNNWTLLPFDEPYNVWSFALDSSGFLYAGTVGGGVFRSTPPVSAVPLIEGSLSSYLLYQNYPNPFNPTTTISFSLFQSGPVELRVFNLRGGEVATLVSQILHVGKYTIDWNASNLPSGIYFYRLQAGSFSETKKLILLK